MRNQRKILLAVVAFLPVGVFAPGCDGPLPIPPAIGRLCAAAVTDGTFCVPSDHDPAEAWRKAEAAGAMPIQMWATWPDDVTLDELIESGDKLNAWFADIDKVVSYVRDWKKSAESYKASMTGHLGALLAQAKDRQAEILAQMPVDAIGDFKQAMSDKASAEKSPLVATIAADK